MEQSRREERIDPRRHAARGLDEQSTIHEGIEAQAVERKGKAYFYRAHSDLDEEKMRGMGEQVQARKKQIEALSSTQQENQGTLQKQETQFQEAIQGADIPNHDDVKGMFIPLRGEKREQLAQKLKTQIGERFMAFRFTEAIQEVAIHLG